MGRSDPESSKVLHSFKILLPLTFGGEIGKEGLGDVGTGLFPTG